MLIKLKDILGLPAARTKQLKDQWSILSASFTSMILIGLLSLWLAPSLHPLIFVASTGASIILVFVLPNSPVSQPYPLLMGQFLSATVGVSCAYLPFDISINAAIAVTVCLLLMFLFNCIHPPGGATAMMPVIVGAQAVGGFNYIIYPVMSNMLILVVLGVVFHYKWLKQDYPSQPTATNDELHKHKDSSPLNRLGIAKSDLKEALQQFDAYLNITEKDLALVFGLAQQNAYSRKFDSVRCIDIMSRDVKTVNAHTELEEAWALLRLHKVKLLPVVGEQNEVIGIISLVDFLKRTDLKNYDGFAKRLERVIKRDPNYVDTNLSGSKPSSVEQIMASPAFIVNQNELISSLVPLLSDKGLHHIPVVDENNHLTGIVTQSDLIAALFTSSINKT
jgi:CBS domain-containing membrane protein